MSMITGSNVNHCDRDGCTALMLSSGTNSEDMGDNCVDYLLKVTFETRNEKGCTEMGYKYGWP